MTGEKPGVRSYRYRLYPSKTAERQLGFTLDACRKVYNHLLSVYRRGEMTTDAAMKAHLVQLKRYWPWLEAVHSRTLQAESERLHNNLRTLMALKRNGHKVGRLRFKDSGWFKGFRYVQSGFRVVKGWGRRCRLLRLSKIGDVRIRWHRSMPRRATVKGVVLKREPDGSWWAILQAEVPETPPEEISGKIGKDSMSLTAIDLNARDNYATDSTGDAFDPPKPYRKSEKRLARERKKLSRKCRGSNNYEKQRRKLAKKEMKVRNQRRDFMHKLARHYVDSFDIIAWESMGVKELMECAWNAKSIQDSAWTEFERTLAYKAESAGKPAIPVPAELLNASRTCFSCGHMLPEELPQGRNTFVCPECGYVEDRHYNAALNVHRAAAQLLRGGCKLNGDDDKLGRGPPEVTPAERVPLLRIPASAVIAGQAPSWKREAPCDSGG